MCEQTLTGANQKTKYAFALVPQTSNIAMKTMRVVLKVLVCFFFTAEFTERQNCEFKTLEFEKKSLEGNKNSVSSFVQEKGSQKKSA